LDHPTSHEVAITLTGGPFIPVSPPLSLSAETGEEKWSMKIQVFIFLSLPLSLSFSLSVSIAI
jgi:hypothetical protein